MSRILIEVDGCTIPGCTRGQDARTVRPWCGEHYSRWLGSPELSASATASAREEQRFVERMAAEAQPAVPVSP